VARFFDKAVRKPMLDYVPMWIRPNHLTIARGLLMFPVVAFVRIWDVPVLAVGILALSSLLDILDGPLARIRKQKTTTGAWLDPAADKFFILGILFFACPERISLLVIALVTVLEAALIAIRPLKDAIGARTNANKFGAAKTWCQSIAIGCVLSQNPKLFVLSTYIFGAAIAFALCSLGGHLRDIFRRLA
jgi:phosphatidylglycerophosphate synthase